jgi:hypothetical protein
MGTLMSGPVFFQIFWVWYFGDDYGALTEKVAFAFHGPQLRQIGISNWIFSEDGAAVLFGLAMADCSKMVR